MTAHAPGGVSPLAEDADRRLRRWLGFQEVRKRVDHEQPLEAVTSRLGPYLSISREEGTGAGEIAHLVGQGLGWEVLDKEILDFMAEHYNLQRNILEFVDETTANWLHEAFSNLIDRQVISQQAYVKRLGSILLLAAYHGKVVLVGRGAQFLLPRDRGLAVRLLAPEKYRIEYVMRLKGLTPDAAKKHIDEKEKGRRDFVHRFFHKDPEDPHLYDLVLNVGKCGPRATADLIIAATKCWLRQSEEHA